MGALTSRCKNRIKLETSPLRTLSKNRRTEAKDGNSMGLLGSLSMRRMYHHTKAMHNRDGNRDFLLTYML